MSPRTSATSAGRDRPRLRPGSVGRRPLPRCAQAAGVGGRRDGNSPPTGVKATVKGATLNVRGGPGTTFPVIASAKKGQSFDVQGKTKDGAWLQLCCFSGKPGWVSAGLVTVTGDLKKVPVPKDLPTPPPAPPSRR